MKIHTPEPTYQYLDQLIKTKTPIVPTLSYVGVKKNGTIIKELSVIYYNHKEHSVGRISNNDFATFMFDNLSSLERGMSSQILVGIVRSSKPDVMEQWSGDTIEKFNHDSFSLYRGLLSIIGKNDGLPLVIPKNTGIVGDIIPGIKQILNGKNPVRIRQNIKQFETLQNKIADIIGDNPYKTDPGITDTTKIISQEGFQGLSDKQIARLEKLKKM